MKQTYLFCLLFISLFSSAQIINFPDANFKAMLLAASSSIQIASTQIPDSWGEVTTYNSIDANNNNEIEVNEAQYITYLNLNFYNINNLTGIEYFTNLQVLILNYNNSITELNLTQNSNLKVLNCMSNIQLVNLNITGLSNLNKLYCDHNELTNINLMGLTNLKTLQCSDNQFSNLDISGLTNLENLSCGFNQLTNLNVSLNLQLEFLSCNNNQLTNLDISQNPQLLELRCENNLLTTINLSNNNNLSNLDCSNNQLTNLNVSQNIQLIELRCNNNQLNILELSNNDNLYDLDCSNNPIETLYIKNNINESYFDYLTFTQSDIFNFSNLTNLQYICADETQIITIQNKISEYGYTNCHVNTYCTFTPGGEFFTIQGQQKFDNENDGCDITDGFIPNLKYSITDGTISASIISDNSGIYSIPVQAGQHTVTPILENPNYFTATPSNAVIDFPTQTSPFTQNFCITPNGNHHDVEVSLIPTNPARPGFDALYKIIYKNKGNQIESGIINLQFNDAILDLVSTNPVFTTQTLNNLSFNYSNLNPFEAREISVVLNVNSPMETPAVVSGDILNYTVTNTITNTDEMLSDNTFVLNQNVVNSYDPNDKTCLQGNYVGPDKIGSYVHYVIRFENTGTFPAENIVVKDLIDTAKFDISSLIPLHASHNYVTKITGNKVEFIFENINLPFDDANNDGYIAFKIKTLPTLVLGNTFSNSANIYFDYNFPIVTNTATTTIAALNNPSFEFANYFSLFPNPTTNELNINLKSAIEINSIQIYNNIGQLVTVQTGNALKVDVSNLKTGNYFIKINTNEGFSTSQFIKE